MKLAWLAILLASACLCGPVQGAGANRQQSSAIPAETSKYMVPGVSSMGMSSIEHIPYTLSVISPAKATTTMADPTAGADGSTNGATVTVTNPGPDTYSVQLLSEQVLLEAGATYQATAWLKSSKPGASVTVKWSSGPPAWKVLSGSLTTVSVSSDYTKYAFPTVTPEAGGRYQLQLDFGGPGVQPDTVFSIDELLVMKTGGDGQSAANTAATSDAVSIVKFEGFEEPGPKLYRGQLTASANANFELSSTDASSSGKQGARITVTKPDSTDWHVQLLSTRWTATAGKAYTLTLDLKASLNQQPFSLDFLQDGVFNTLVTKDYKATTEWYTYSISYTADRDVPIMNTIDLGGAMQGTVFEIDNVIISVDTNSSQHGTMALVETGTSGFEPGQNQPFTGQVLAPAIGKIDLASNAAPRNGSQCAAVTVTSPVRNGEAWRIQLSSGYIQLEAGVTYTVTAHLKATANSVPVGFAWVSEGPDYRTLQGSARQIIVGTTYEEYVFAVTPAAGGSHRINFDFAAAPAGTVVYVDDIATNHASK